MKYFHFSFSELEYKHYLYTWCQQGCPQESAFKILFIVENSLRKVPILQSSFIVPVMGTCSCCASSFPHFSLQSSSKHSMEILIPYILSSWNRKNLKWGKKREQKGGLGTWDATLRYVLNVEGKCLIFKQQFKNIFDKLNKRQIHFTILTLLSW